MQQPNPYTHIVWDWNGTLFNDVDWCLSVINAMLEKRGLPALPGLAAYRQVFRFPVAEYYKEVGFRFEEEPFEVLAEEYMAGYHQNKTGHCGLHAGAQEVLQALQAGGYTQVVLSASKAEHLAAQMAEFSILPYFTETVGLTDIYAKSKVEAGLAYMARAKPKRALLVGDTQHDYEVARALGADCLLLAKGHQGKEQLLACGVPVLEDIRQVPGWLAGAPAG